MARSRHNEKGSVLVEFVLGGIPVILLTLSVLQVCLCMWYYHTIEMAAAEGSRYASTKGPGCHYTTSSCAVTVAAVAARVASASAGLQPALLKVTLTSTAGSIICTPVTACYSNSVTWPPASAANDSVIGVTTFYSTPVILAPFSANWIINSVTLSANSQQKLIF